MIIRAENRTLLFFMILLMLFGIFFFSAAACADSMLETGSVVNGKMKSLAGGAEMPPWEETDHIKAIHMADSLPDNFIPSDANIVSTANSLYPIYIFFDNEENAGIIYFYTEDSTVVMNPDSSYMFAFNSALTDISGLASWNSSGVIYMNCIFMDDLSLSDITPLSNWDIHNVTMLTQAFCNNISLEDILALANWDTSNVTDMSGLFGGAISVSDALALRSWNTSNVTDMSYMFSGCTSMMFIDVSKWNTGKVKTMANMFQVGKSHAGDGQLKEIIGLSYLDVSCVTDMTCMFYGAGQMTNYDVACWDVSKVESMNHMFCDNHKLRSLDLSGWDVSSLKTVYDMFDDNYKLKTIGDVSHWNTANLIDAGGWLNNASSFVGDNYGMLDLSGWDTRNLKSAGEMFLNTKICTIDLSGWTFDSITNDIWEGAWKGIYYEVGNSSKTLKGMGQMFKNTPQLTAVFVSQAGLESYNKAVEKEVNTLDMWTGSKSRGFTVK